MDKQQQQQQQSYNVLYWIKRNKVHKSKGVSKMDGILTIENAPSNLVSLAALSMEQDEDDSSDSCSSSDDDDENNKEMMNSKRKWKQSNQKRKWSKNPRHRFQNQTFASKDSTRNNSTTNALSVYSAVLPNLVQQAFQSNDHEHGFDLDVILDLSKWQVQIVSKLDANAISTTSDSSTMNSSSSAIGHTSLSRSFPSKGLASKRLNYPSHGLGKNTIPLVQRRTTNPTSVRAIPFQDRKPPAQPKPKVESSSNDSSSEALTLDDLPDTSTSTSTSTTTSSSTTTNSTNSTVTQKPILLSSSNRKNLIPNRTPSRLSSSSNDGIIQRNKTTLMTSQKWFKSSTLVVKHHPPSNDTKDDFFSGAIGTIPAPMTIKQILKPHQISGVVFLWNVLTGACPKLQKILDDVKHSDTNDDDMNDTKFQNNIRRGAILADEMGLGKTLMTITTIVSLHRRNRSERFIVICPSSLVANWAQEFDKFLGKASQPHRVVIRKGGEEGLQKLKSFVQMKHTSEVLIVSYDFFRMHSTLMSKATNVGILVVDEGHKLKNTNGSQTLSAIQALPCNTRLLITGTPIQNCLSEFYTVANFVLPGILGDLNSFRKNFEHPITTAGKKNATSFQKEQGRLATRELEKVTSTFMLRRLQADVLKSVLPPRKEMVLFCRPSDTQSKLYRACVTSSGDDRLSTLMSLRKLCSHPSLVEENIHSTIHEISSSGKLFILERLLETIYRTNPTDKVVVVSNFTSALTVIEQSILTPKKWSSIRLDGTTERSVRQTLVNSFNRGSRDSSFVFLLSSKAGGCGLNLIGANRLIMFDLDWNPATDAQAMARIYRHQQTKPCYIYRLITTGTVEEVILQRQIQKNNLDTISSRQQGNFNSFTDEEIRDCFTLKEDCICDTKNELGARREDYNGQESLREQGLHDEVLLNVAKSEKNVLTYVHIAQESEESIIKDDSSADVDDDESESELEKGFTSDSSEEAEFEE